MSAITVDPLGPEQREGALWTGAALIVVAVHVALVGGYLLLRPAPAERAEAPAVDVAFMPATEKPAPAAPEALPAEPVPPVEQSDLAPPVAEPEPVEKAEPQPEPPPPAVAVTIPEPIAPPTPPDDATITAAIEPPPPPPKPVTAPERPAPRPAAEDDKPEKAKREKAEQKKEREAKEKEARKLAQQRASSASQAQRIAAAPNAGLESEGARAGQANWNSEVVAQIRRNAAYPADGGGASGTVQISVSISRNGRLLSHRLAASSGSPALDRAAMAIIERAQPFPPFPAGMTQAQVSRTVPLHLRPR